MRFNLARINCFVIVIMENRSFDHMLGHLAFSNPEINGLSRDPAWLARYENSCADSQPCAPFYRQGQLTLSDDPGHERPNIALQIGLPPWPDGEAPMNGFMKSYAETKVAPDKRCEVMGYYMDDEVPIISFLAENFALCDRWFAPLPTSTQPNRLMAMTGYSLIDNTLSDIIPNHRLVYDWLQARGVDWRVYHAGWPFFMMMPHWMGRILGDAVFQTKFRSFDRLEEDLRNDPVGPEVIFVEPKYTSDPMRTEVPSDDHAPSSIAGGQAFLRRVYCALKQNATRWESSLLIITYDENGGLFDHEQPLPVETHPPSDAKWTDPFLTTGVRVPGLLISPLVGSGVVVRKDGKSIPFDHTSILRLLAERFDTDKRYSDEVDNRHGVESLSAALDAVGLDAPRRIIPEPPPYAIPQSAADLAREQARTRRITDIDKAFLSALLQARRDHPVEAANKFPQLHDFMLSPLWRQVEDTIRENGMTLDRIEPALKSFVENGESKLLAEPERRQEALQNLSRFLDELIQEARPRGRSIDGPTFSNVCTKLRPLWPYS